MLFCYLLKYGGTPFSFWLHGRDFHDERRKWVDENTDSFRGEGGHLKSWLTKEKMAINAIESKYSDPANLGEVLTELKSYRTLGEVNELINLMFPDWQVATLTGFCEGYPHLTLNWQTLCKRIGVSCAQIIIVRKLAFDEDHMLLRNFMECLTRAGFAVKRMVDYVPCTKCEKIAVPTPQIHNLMKEKGITVPEVNMPICKNCK